MLQEETEPQVIVISGRQKCTDKKWMIKLMKDKGLEPVVTAGMGENFYREYIKQQQKEIQKLSQFLFKDKP